MQWRIWRFAAMHNADLADDSLAKAQGTLQRGSASGGVPLDSPRDGADHWYPPVPGAVILERAPSADRSTPEDTQKGHTKHLREPTRAPSVVLGRPRRVPHATIAGGSSAGATRRVAHALAPNPGST